MDNPLLRSLSLLDTSGYVIIAIIVVLLASAILLTLAIRGRYALLERELRRGGFSSRVLRRILDDAEAARAQNPYEINTQAIIERGFDAELGGLLVGERFIKATTGLLIILGLVGTFYGLTLSIGRLVSLVTGEGADAAAAESLMEGLAQALSGMSVAFSCSLFGIAGAIIMTLVSVFASVSDRRIAVMVAIEAYLDNEFAAAAPASRAGVRGPGAMTAATSDDIDRLLAGFGESVAQLQNSVAHFEAALVNFATTTRDFREFNFHLKDNVQRMSLSFGDLSETLKEHSRALRPRG